MKKTLIRVLSAVLCLAVFIPCLSFSTSAEKISYVSAANGVSDAYKNSRYYKNLTSIELTGDGAWFCKKFDYLYKDEPWGDSKDAVERAIKLLSGDEM